jgi:hypothetical protein
MKRVYLIALALIALSATTLEAATLEWSTAHSQASSTTNQLRAVAVSDQPGNDSVYLGYIQTTGGNRRIERRDTAAPYSVLNSVMMGDQPKGIATDDRGYVFSANRGSSTTSSYIQAWSSTLTPVVGGTTSFTSPVIGGIAVQKVGAVYYAYTVYESGGLVQRYDVTNPAAMTLDTSFGLAGSYIIPGGSNLRGIEVAADGTIYVAARTDGQVYRVSSDLMSVASFPLNRAMDVALEGSTLYATSYDGANSFIRVLDATNMAFVEDISISTLDGNPYSRGATEGFSGVDVDATGSLWLADQHYGSAGGTQDRLLVGAVPEPASALIAGLALVGLAIARRR